MEEYPLASDDLDSFMRASSFNVLDDDERVRREERAEEEREREERGIREEEDQWRRREEDDGRRRREERVSRSGGLLYALSGDSHFIDPATSFFNFQNQKLQFLDPNSWGQGKREGEGKGESEVEEEKEEGNQGLLGDGFSTRWNQL